MTLENNAFFWARC